MELPWGQKLHKVNFRWGSYNFRNRFGFVQSRNENQIMDNHCCGINVHAGDDFAWLYSVLYYTPRGGKIAIAAELSYSADIKPLEWSNSAGCYPAEYICRVSCTPRVAIFCKERAYSAEWLFCWISPHGVAKYAGVSFTAEWPTFCWVWCPKD